jgi:hypothetical protein
MGSLSERGTLSPSRKTVIFWGVVMGAVAAVMLLIGGDEALTGLQNLTIIAALPFALVMVGLAVSLAKDVRSDPMVLRRTYATEAVEQAVVDGITRHGDDFVLVVEAAKETDEGGTVGARPVQFRGNSAGPAPVTEETRTGAVGGSSVPGTPGPAGRPHPGR